MIHRYLFCCEHLRMCAYVRLISGISTKHLPRVQGTWQRLGPRPSKMIIPTCTWSDRCLQSLETDSGGSLVPRPYFFLLLSLFININYRREWTTWGSKERNGRTVLRKSKAWFGKSRDPQGFLRTWAICSPQSWRKVFSHAFRVVVRLCWHSISLPEYHKLLYCKSGRSNSSNSVASSGDSSYLLDDRLSY